MARAIEIPTALLLACAPFGRELSARIVADALTSGLVAGGRPQPDVLTLPGRDPGAARIGQLLEREHFDARMRAARAVVICVPRLHESTLAGSPAFELATRARQSGVPCYSVARENLLNSFDERVLDLQTVLEAADRAALQRAGRKLAKIT